MNHLLPAAINTLVVQTDVFANTILAGDIWSAKWTDYVVMFRKRNIPHREAVPLG